MKSGIYCIRNIIDGKRYVGSSSSLMRRKYDHWFKLKRGDNGCVLLQHAWGKYGAESFVFEILEHCDPGVLLEREDWWIDHLSTRDREKGYNLGSAVRGRTGLKHSEETKAKIGAANSGKSPSAETRARMAAAKVGTQNAAGHKLSDRWKVAHSARMKGSVPPNKGVPMSEATRAKVSAALTGRESPMKGRVFSDEHRAKLSASKAGKPGRPWTDEQRARQSTVMQGNNQGRRSSAPLPPPGDSDE